MSSFTRAFDEAMDEMLGVVLVVLAIVIGIWLLVAWQIWLAIDAHLRYQASVEDAKRDFDFIVADEGVGYPADDVLYALYGDDLPLSETNGDVVAVFSTRDDGGGGRAF